MAANQYGPLSVRAKTNQVIDHHYDDSKPGKPLYLLIPGGLIALACLALIVLVAYETWLAGNLASSTGFLLIVLLFPFYVGAVFVFSYGYELYDLPRALRLTAIIVFLTVAAVVILAALFVVLAALSSGKSSSSESSKSSSSSRSSSYGGGGSSRWSGAGLGPIFVGTPTPTITREVVHEVPVGPPKPQAIVCPYCGRQYISEETHFACPSCGAPTPDELRTLNLNPSS